MVVNPLFGSWKVANFQSVAGVVRDCHVSALVPSWLVLEGVDFTGCDRITNQSLKLIGEW